MSHAGTARRSELRAPHKTSRRPPSDLLRGAALRSLQGTSVPFRSRALLRSQLLGGLGPVLFGALTVLELHPAIDEDRRDLELAAQRFHVATQRGGQMVAAIFQS